MMESNIFARVYLTCNGSIYIAFSSRKIIVCSFRSLSSLISNPFALHKGMMGEFKDVSKSENPHHLSIDKIPGLSLIFIGNDSSMHCEYPIIMQAMFASSLPSKQNEPLRLHLPSDSSAIEDEKCFFLRAFYAIIDAFSGIPRFKNKAPTSEEFRQRFFDETLRAFGLATENKQAAALSNSSEPMLPSVTVMPPADELLPNGQVFEEFPEGKDFLNIPSNYVSTPDFAELHNVSTGTVHGWIHKGKIPCEKYMKLPNGHFYIDASAERPIDGRSTRYADAKEKEPRRPKYSRKNASYEDTQRRIQDDNIVSDAIRPYITDFREAQYYRKHAHHEVVINGKPALIVDIFPEYYCESLGKTNRELILEGKAPVVPDSGEQRYHLHHIGQQKKSPLAIIPEADHNSESLYSAFHSNSNCEPGIHGKEFEAEKKAFWLSYLKLYDAHGKDFKKIPYNNKRNRLPRNQREWRQ